MVFDRALQPNPALTTSNWTLVADNKSWECDAASSTGLHVDLHDNGLFVPAGSGKLISYAATPPDVLSTEAVPAGAFVNFPVA